ncbi:hypothetical protein E2C01_018167 [Portunus trituberculatus]|uniref:Uncharacterized protein n=1 Tax=Portunus trituberculatus TaxID=210409 RepID=A0A5B7DUD9_PORTR|nr:hypothetical protein [Portunus trituberculatus]
MFYYLQQDLEEAPLISCLQQNVEEATWMSHSSQQDDAFLWSCALRNPCSELLAMLLTNNTTTLVAAATAVKGVTDVFS